MSKRGDMKRLVKDAVGRGWVSMQRRDHYKLQWKDGTVIITSLTPSDHHALKNARADLKRVERQYLDNGPAKPYTHDK